MRSLRSFPCGLILLTLLVPAGAGIVQARAHAGPRAVLADARVAPMADPVLPPCTCRALGRVFDMGEEACLETPRGPRMAICGMDQNVSAWKSTERTCPSASRGDRRA
jgi:hypothetical protein